MGCCYPKRVNWSKIHNENTSELTYPRVASLKIKKRGSRGRVTSIESLTINHTEPMLCICEEISINFLTWASACILPGVDPHEKLYKTCQDFCFFSSNGTSIILGLFDGHGKDGEHLASTCIKESDDFFHRNMQDFEDSPLDFLQSLITHIVKRLKDPSSMVDLKVSGCSCSVSLIHKDSLYSINIGNTRAVLASFKSSLVPEPRHITAFQEKPAQNDLSKRRRGSLTRQPLAVQLTVDHTTENQKEFMRVLKAGGKILKPEGVPDEKEVPSRVYLPHSKMPDIVLTRAIGFSIAESIGIVPLADSHKHSLECEDEFIVIASEGIWTVMTNKDVIEFVNKYRVLAIKRLEERKTGEKVTIENACISQLLCEEARVRWLKVVEENDVVIEDISCVILEFDKRVEKRSNTFYRMPIDRIETSKDVSK